MRRAFRRAWWALTLSAGVSLVPIAIAQQRIEPSSLPAHLNGQVAASPGRAVEIQVELAWLNDPLTFPCQIGAHVGSDGLELRGYVPSATVRERAGRLAREACSMTVVDHLHVQAGVADNPIHYRAERLQFAVANCLKLNFAAHLAGMKATCNDQGQVTVSGTISTREDKLSVSQQLRRVAGCTCVHNQLRALDEASEPVAMGPIGFPPDVPVRNAEPVKKAEMANKASGLQPKATTFADAARPLEPKVPMPPTGTGFAAAGTSKVDAVPPAKLPSLQPSPPMYANAATSPYNPLGSSAGNTPPPLPTSVTVPPPPVALAAQSPGQSWKPSPPAASTSTAPVSSAPAVKSDPAGRPALATMTATDKLGEPYVTTGVVMVTETAATGTVPSTPVPLPTPPAPPVTRLSTGAVKTAIEKLCGPKIQSVEVKLEAGNKVAIQFAAPTEADGQLFFDRIQSLPELAPYEVNVKVTTAK